MSRDHTAIDRGTLLDRIRETRGAAAAETAQNMLNLANDIGCTEVPGHCSISVRLEVPNTNPSDWLTMYVISQAGTFYLGWHERWAKARADASLADTYENRLKAILGVDCVKYHPTQYEQAVPLQLIAAHDNEIRTAIQTTAAELRRQVL